MREFGLVRGAPMPAWPRAGAVHCLRIDDSFPLNKNATATTTTTITTTVSQDEYDLDALPTRPLLYENPHYVSGPPMQLYVLQEVIARSEEKRAAKEAARRERQARAAERAAERAVEAKRRRAEEAASAERAVGTAADRECRRDRFQCLL